MASARIQMQLRFTTAYYKTKYENIASFLYSIIDASNANTAYHPLEELRLIKIHMLSMRDRVQCTLYFLVRKSKKYVFLYFIALSFNVRVREEDVCVILTNLHKRRVEQIVNMIIIFRTI